MYSEKEIKKICIPYHNFAGCNVKNVLFGTDLGTKPIDERPNLIGKTVVPNGDCCIPCKAIACKKRKKPSD